MPFLAKLREPIITNRGLDLLAVLSWLCFAWWGILSTINGVPSIERASTPLYQLIWGGSIGVLALIGAIMAGSMFFNIPFVSPAMKKWVELSAVVLMTGFVSVYPTVIITQALAGHPDYTALSGIAIYYILFPVWRILHLWGRIKDLTTLKTI